MQIQRYKKHARKFMILTWFLFMLLIFAIVCLDRRARPVILGIAQMKSREYCVNAMHQAVKTCLSDMPEAFSNLYAINKNKAGEIVGAECDSLRLNQVQNNLEDLIGQKLLMLKKIDINIPVGTLCGLHVFSGRGPLVPVVMIPISAVESRIETSFKSAGVNQTLVVSDLILTINVRTCFAGFESQESVDCKIRVSEILVVGETPEFYVNS